MVLAGITSSFQDIQAPRCTVQGTAAAGTPEQSQETVVLGGARDFCQTIYQGKNLAELLKDSRFCAQAQAHVQSLPSGALTCEALSDKASPATVKEEFQVRGADDNGFYKSITGSMDGKKVELSMTREASSVQVGGILIEQAPLYRISGECAGIPVSMMVKSEDLISSIGGINVQTGTVYHVEGKIGDRELRASISHEDTVQDIGGINVQTATTARLKGDDGGAPDLTVKGVSVIENVGGIQIEQDSYDAISGSDRGGAVDAAMHDHGRTLSVEGIIPAETLALVLGLKPFLYAAG